MYLNYAEYKAKGGSLEHSAFEVYRKQAESLINSQSAELTGKRIAKLMEIPEAIKDCVFELIYLSESTSGIVASESQSSGGVSESVSYITKTEQDISDEQESIIYNAFYGNNIGYMLTRGYINGD